jgi:hypothetical protein
MKLKLKLTKNELGSLLQIAATFAAHNAEKPFFRLYSYVTCFEGFITKHYPKFRSGTVKEKNNRITLTSLETLAFFDVCSAWAEVNISPFEQVLVRKVLETIAQQMDSEMMRRMAAMKV